MTTESIFFDQADLLATRQLMAEKHGHELTPAEIAAMDRQIIDKLASATGFTRKHVAQVVRYNRALRSEAKLVILKACREYTQVPVQILVEALTDSDTFGLSGMTGEIVRDVIDALVEDGKLVRIGEDVMGR